MNTQASTLQTVCPHCGTINRIEQTRLVQKPNCGRCHQALFSGAPLAADDALFSRLLAKEELPLVVDFWAAWCGPCKMMAPIFAATAASLEPRARFVKVDTEVAQQTAAAFNIRSIPTLAIFHRGKQLVQQAGALPQQQFSAWVLQNLPR
ncbi:MAG: thioredoxin TrxC [Haliea sp.]|uniref:thioredoxin TrxC n=1 Tax=Haliea sp. TaxID=1932666 RepID=UPI0032EB93DA